jgi:TetR/AcrR family transcriptional regulator, cholesterol catabolism regulator
MMSVAAFHPNNRSMAETKREAICDAALSLFASQGIDATSTRQIAKRAGTAEGNIYRHFRGKDALVRHLFEENAMALHQTLAEAVDEADDPLERLGALVRGVFAFAADQPVGFAFLFMVSTTGAFHDDPAEWPLPMMLFAETLKGGFRSGNFRPVDPALATGWIVAMTQRAVILHRTGIVQLGYDELVSQTVEAVQQLLRR